MSPSARGRPLIGVTCYEEEATFCGWTERSAVLPAAFVHALSSSGAAAVAIPPQELLDSDAAELCSRLDGLVLSGGGDVDPARYGAGRHEATGEVRRERDELELGVLGAAVEDGLPTLAICRGIQLLNVWRGGSLLQHLPEAVGTTAHAPLPGDYGSHEVFLVEGSLVARLSGWERGSVPTHHHQAVDEPGTGLVVSARAPDGVVEAVEDASLPFLLGVQWHPEAGEDLSLFRGLVAAAAEHASSA